MIEKQSINGKDVWVRVDPYHVDRPNPNIIPTEYFTATYYVDEPTTENNGGQTINDDAGKPRLFESPVEALSCIRKQLETGL
ncbi:MAG: hypothetical protein ACXVLT_10385 [Flavisolibacter sp.]